MNLTKSQIERLAFLSEELAEAAQMVGKTLRHGFDSTHHDYGYVNNDVLLSKELGHVLAAVDLLVQCRDISLAVIKEAQSEKTAKIGRGTHFHFQAPTGDDGQSADEERRPG